MVVLIPIIIIDSVILSSQMLVCVTLRQGCIRQLWWTQQLQATNCPVWSFEYCCVQQVACLWHFLATKLHRIDSWSILGNMLRSTNVVACNRYCTCVSPMTMRCVACNFVVVPTKLPSVFPPLIYSVFSDCSHVYILLCFPTKCFRALGA